VATEGMLGNLNPLGDGPGRSLADHGARVPEVLPAAELEPRLSSQSSWESESFPLLLFASRHPICF
jgi:hypothetical protein